MTMTPPPIHMGPSWGGRGGGGGELINAFNNPFRWIFSILAVFKDNVADLPSRLCSHQLSWRGVFPCDTPRIPTRQEKQMACSLLSILLVVWYGWEVEGRGGTCVESETVSPTWSVEEGGRVKHWTVDVFASINWRYRRKRWILILSLAWEIVWIYNLV